jgi:hypothetical protein
VSDVVIQVSNALVHPRLLLVECAPGRYLRNGDGCDPLLLHGPSRRGEDLFVELDVPVVSEYSVSIRTSAYALLSINGVCTFLNSLPTSCTALLGEAEIAPSSSVPADFATYVDASPRPKSQLTWILQLRGLSAVFLASPRCCTGHGSLLPGARVCVLLSLGALIMDDAPCRR